MARRSSVWGLCVALFCLAACTAPRSVGNVELHGRSEYVERVRIDSIVLHDSVFIREKADTVFYTKYRTIFKERLRVDTLIRQDTLFLERNVVVADDENGKKSALRIWRALTFFLLVYQMWRSGLLRRLFNFILKGVGLCIRVFRLRG